MDSPLLKSWLKFNDYHIEEGKKRTVNGCEYCGKPMEREAIACPDDKPGCCVYHFRFVCIDKCEYKESNS